MATDVEAYDIIGSWPHSIGSLIGKVTGSFKMGRVSSYPQWIGWNVLKCLDDWINTCVILQTTWT